MGLYHYFKLLNFLKTSVKQKKIYQEDKGNLAVENCCRKWDWVALISQNFLLTYLRFGLATMNSVRSLKLSK